MLKKRTLSLLLSLAMLFAFMPAMAFAEDAADDTSDQPAVMETAEDEAAEEVQGADLEEPAEDLNAEDLGEEDPDEEDDEFVEVVGLEYEGPTLYIDPWDEPSSVYPYVDDAKFVVSYSDGTTENIVLKWFKDGDDCDFFFEDEEPIFDEDDDYPINVALLWFDFDNATLEKGLTVDFEGATTTIPIDENVYAKPVNVEFVPAEGFAAYGLIGENYLYDYEFYGEGNKFIVTWEEGDKTEVKEYNYVETEDGECGFLYSDDDSNQWLWFSLKLDKRLAKGTADYTGKMSIECDYEGVELPFTATVSADMYKAYVQFKSYSYTGKNIKPKVVVKYWNGKAFKTMSSKWYTCKPAKHKAIGWYEFDVKIKAKYQAKYGDELYGSWEILPKTPAIKKATAKKGTVTVTWGKFSKALQKSIDGFIIQISTDKAFNNVIEEVEAGPAAAKATFKDMDKGTYYVRLYSRAFPEVDGSEWWSMPSKVKKVKVK